MNERIQELALQADKFADDTLQMVGEFHPDWHEIRDEKFALLIAEECANVADENYIHRGSRTCGLAIRLHFGVEA